MQAKTDTVIVRGPDGNPVTLENVNTLMGSLGLFVKSEDKVEMYVWENILYMKWTDIKAREAVWEEALAELIAEAFDEDEWDDEYEETPLPVVETPVEVVETPVEVLPESKAEAPITSDDTDVDPYAN
jgi:hypothetical protein